MQIIEVTPNFEYSCQYCQSKITSNEEVRIIEFEKPYCTKSCLFKFCYRLALYYFPDAKKDVLFDWTKQFAGVLK